MAEVDQDIRLSVIREICRKEGHGELVDVTTIRDSPVRREVLCQRGCGMYILELIEAMDLVSVQQLLERREIKGTVRLRGTIEVED